MAAIQGDTTNINSDHTLVQNLSDAVQTDNGNNNLSSTQGNIVQVTAINSSNQT